jgi:hypothetical protein
VSGPANDSGDVDPIEHPGQRVIGELAEALRGKFTEAPWREHHEVLPPYWETRSLAMQACELRAGETIRTQAVDPRTREVNHGRRGRHDHDPLHRDVGPAFRARRVSAHDDSLTPLETIVDLLVMVRTPLDVATRAKMARQVQAVLDSVREVAPASFICPRCAMRSYNPNDIREGYCGACHDWTARP